MTTSDFSYSKTYVLDKSHFLETFEESVTIDTTLKPYYKAFAVAIVGLLLLLFTTISAYFCWFIIGLGVVEALSVRFQKAWWLWRQLISKAANNEMTLTITNDGILSKSRYVEHQINWQDIIKIKSTERGWLLFLKVGKSYVSNRCLSDEAQEFMSQKMGEINS